MDTSCMRILFWAVLASIIIIVIVATINEDCIARDRPWDEPK